MSADTETETTLVDISRDRAELRTGVLSARLTPCRGFVGISLLATRALLLAGDDVTLRVRVAGDVRVWLHDIAATVAYHGRGGTARLHVDLAVEAGGLLVWEAQPLVLSDGASVVRSLTASCAAGGRMLLRDTVVLGRSGQAGGSLCCRTRISYDGRPALAEDLQLDSDPGRGVLGGARVLDTVTAVGWRPPAPAHGTCFELHEPGTMARDLTSDAHLSVMPTVWRAWCPRAGS